MNNTVKYVIALSHKLGYQGKVTDAFLEGANMQLHVDHGVYAYGTERMKDKLLKQCNTYSTRG